MPDPANQPKPPQPSRPKPDPCMGNICPKCGHWDADAGRHAGPDGTITIDIAGWDAAVVLIRNLRDFARRNPEFAEEIEGIITRWEMKK